MGRTDSGQQRARAESFLALHESPDVLVLPNAWDVATARIFEELPGCRAIATTSGGIAAALGYADGEHISREEMLAVVERIARAVAVPVSADLEMGFGVDAAEVAETARVAIAAGAVRDDGMTIAPALELLGQARRIEGSRLPSQPR